jgi:hypothetical protein
MPAALSVAVSWGRSRNSVLQLRTRAKWIEVTRGLRAAVAGHGLLLGLAAPGLLLWALAVHGGSAWHERLGLAGQEEAACNVGLVLAGAGFILGATLIFLGRWLCLVHAPKSSDSRGLMLCCVLATVLGPAALVAAHFLGGARNYVVFRQGLGAFDLWDFLRSNGPLQACGLALTGLGSLLFTRFTRQAATAFDDAPRARGVDWYCRLVFFVVGGFAGAVASPYDTRSTILLGVAGVWAVGLLWNVALLADARRGILAALAERDRRPGPSSRLRTTGAYSRPYVGIHRESRLVSI